MNMQNKFKWLVHREGPMMMDIGTLKLMKEDEFTIKLEGEECIVLLQSGRVEFSAIGIKKEASRSSVFEEKASLIHCATGEVLKINALENSELLVQMTDNKEKFPTAFYGREDNKAEIFGEHLYGGAAERAVVTFVDYSINPKSRLVMGEVYNYPGRWSSYIPHHHPQPEVYYYKFNRAHGFGAAFLDDEVYKVTNDSVMEIPGGKTHPQVSAPGYVMYYTWMIRHFDEAPWTERINDEKHTWLLENENENWSFNLK